ncbi:MAG: argininosuccinate lyase [Alphaproteobacteria bacterium]
MSDSSNKSSNQMWGGRFASGPAEVMTLINASIDIDKRFYAEDIAGSIAHATMLGRQGIITQDEAAEIVRGLGMVREEIEAGSFDFSHALEDIHMNVESRLKDLIGEVAGKLHTGRSRNDQVATDFRLWLRGAIDALCELIDGLSEQLEELAGQHEQTILPGFTHLQVAQPITLAAHFRAYVEMLGRDKGRMVDCRKRLNECPLGAAALAGTSFPIDRDFTADQLGFDRPMANTLDAVASRDFALEFLSAASICAIHLSRLAEEMVLWASQAFGFVTPGDLYASGSSIMPQKKNPDAAELVRAKSGQMLGNLTALTVVMKGLPLAYNKDMQEDKRPVFETVDALGLCLEAMRGVIGDLSVNQTAMRALVERGHATATDLADWLVRELSLPFRQAHHITGTLVKLADDRSCQLADLPLEDMQAVEPGITEDIYTALSIDSSVAGRLK